jgi:hypothetical protein
MVQPTIEQLFARIETLEGRQRSRSRRRGAKTLLSVVALAALLAVPIGVFANHSFTDVPNSHTFHTVIGRVKGAGITAGCTATTYCPEANVSRGQMAAFLARTGGRASTAGTNQLVGVPISTDPGLPTVLTTVTIKAGDVTGGYAIVQLTGSMTAYTNSATGLPSYALAFIREAGTTAVLSSWGFAQVDALAGGSYGIATAGLVGAVSVPTGVTKTYEVVGYRAYGTGTFLAFATLSALYVPFRGDGTNALPAAAPEPASERSPLLGP